MKIIEKFAQKQAQLRDAPAPVLAFLGDSVTHGCFEIYDRSGRVETEFRPEEGYAARVRQIFATLFPTVVPVIVNAGISGDTADGGFKRLDRDVLRLHPDLVVVCYGLNDAGRAAAGLDRYRAALHQIFAKIHPSGAEVIFLTPNLRVTHPQRPFRNPVLDDVAASVAENERVGWLARYLDGARAVCRADGVPVCDCNALWTAMQAAGVDTDELLANRVNHPTPALHGMFAYELVKTMFLS